MSATTDTAQQSFDVKVSLTGDGWGPTKYHVVVKDPKTHGYSQSYAAFRWSARWTARNLARAMADPVVECYRLRREP